MATGAPGLDVGIDAKNRILGFCYDDAGNLLGQSECPSYQYNYDAENRLTATAGVSYIYDGDGRRVMKDNGRLYWYGVGGEVLLETDSAGNNPKEYIFFAGKRIARRESSGAIYYYFDDHLGSSRVVTDANGNGCYAADYYPYGGERVYVNSCAEHYKFTGKERDPESTLDYFGARHYASNLGRYMSPDSIDNDFVLADPRSLNRYSYARNNPLKFIDPEGEAIELVGTTEDERKRALEEIKKALRDKKTADRLYINVVKEGDKVRYFVGIKGDVGKFAETSKVAGDVVNLVEDNRVVEFALTDQPLPGEGRGCAAYTYEPGSIGNENIRVLINPELVSREDISYRYSIRGRWLFQGAGAWQINPITLQGAAWHEFGHGWAMMQGRRGGETIQEAIDWENRMREHLYGPLGPKNAPRVKH